MSNSLRPAVFRSMQLAFILCRVIINDSFCQSNPYHKRATPVIQNVTEGQLTVDDYVATGRQTHHCATGERRALVVADADVVE